MSSGTENNNLRCEIPIMDPGNDRSASMDVKLWSNILSSIYESPTDMRATTVRQLDWYKYAGGVEHEYVIATVLSRGRSSYLRIERRASDDTIVIEENALEQETIDSFTPEYRARFSKDISTEKSAVRSRKSRGSSSKSSSSKDNLPRADDSVTQVLSHKGITGDDEGDSDVHLLASYDFSASTPLYLRDLAFIVKHINKSSVGYKLLMEQCYWFARTCIGVAKYRCGPKESRTTRWNTAGTYWVAKFDTPRIRSEVSRLTINKDNLPQIEELARAVDVNIRESDEHLQGKYMNGEGGRLLAEQVAEEERRQKVQETRRAELAEKAVEQERRRADEAHAELQQLRAQFTLSQTNSMSPKAQ